MPPSGTISLLNWPLQVDCHSIFSWHSLSTVLKMKGPVGMAAAAAINSSKKRKRPHSFETNPSIRRRQQTRLLRKLRQTIDEYATRVGQQAIVLIATPGKPQNNFRVFGAKPLEDVIKNVKATVLQVSTLPPCHEMATYCSRRTLKPPWRTTLRRQLKTTPRSTNCRL